MKKMILLFFMLVLNLGYGVNGDAVGNLSNQDSNGVAFVLQDLIHRQQIRKAIIKVESEFDTFAYNKKEKAVGLYQIRPIRLKDFNNRTGKDYHLTLMFIPEYAQEVFDYYADSIGWDNTEHIIRQWNGGDNGMKKKQTKKYYLKVSKYLTI